MRFLPFLLLALLGLPAFSDDSPTQKSFMEERGLDHKQTALHCTQATNYLQFNYAAFSAAHPERSASNPLEDIKREFAEWSRKSIYMYGSAEQAELAQPSVSNSFTAQLSKNRQTLFASEPRGKGDLSALYYEVLRCREISSEQDLLETSAQLSSNKYELELSKTSPPVQHDRAWNRQPSQPPYITMSANTYAPVLELVIVPGCNHCHAQIAKHSDRLRRLIDSGRITLKILDTVSESRTGFGRDVSQLNQCVYRRQGARAYFDIVAALPDAIELVTGRAADTTTGDRLSRYGAQIVAQLEQVAGITLSECFGTVDRSKIWNARMVAAADRQALLPGATRTDKFVWRGSPYFGDLNDVPEIAALK